MDIAAVMDEIADRLRTIPTLTGRTFGYPPSKVVPPAAIVAYPEALDFDATYGRGMDRLRVPVVVVVGRVVDRAARDQLAAYAAGAGGESVKASLERGPVSVDPPFDDLHVTGAEFEPVSIGGVDYIAAVFTCEIAGQGG